MKNKFILFSLLLFLLFINKVNADDGLCSKTDIMRVKSDANKVYIKYEHIDEDIYDDNISGLFNIYIYGVTEDMILIDEDTGYVYSKKSEKDGSIKIEHINGKKFVFKIYYNYCDKKYMRTIKLNLPKFNTYSNNDLCLKNKEKKLEVCDKWFQGDVNEQIIQTKIEEFDELHKKNTEQENKIIVKIKNFLINYYFYIILIVVLIVFTTTFIIVKKKKSYLE